MNVRTMIRSGQSTVSAANGASIGQIINVAENGAGVNVVAALNIAAQAQTSVATNVSTGSVSVSVSV